MAIYPHIRLILVHPKDNCNLEEQGEVVYEIM